MKTDVKRERQTIMVRGIAAAIQAMHSPSFQNLKDILAKFGWKLTRDDSQTNKHESSKTD